MYYFKYKTTNITGIPRGKNHELNRNDSRSTVIKIVVPHSYEAVENCELTMSYTMNPR